MAEDRFKAQARSIIEGCPFNVEDAITDNLREADAKKSEAPRGDVVGLRYAGTPRKINRLD